MKRCRGRRFRPEVVRQPGPWPHLAGPVGHEAALIRTWGELQALFNPVGLQLTRLTHDERRAWRLSFANGLEVYVGRDQFEARLRRLAQLYPRVLAGQIDQIAAVDLRYGNASRCAENRQRHHQRCGLSGNRNSHIQKNRSKSGWLDIGTSKVVAMVGETSPDGTITVVGLGVHPARGLKKGVVVNIESTVESIRQGSR